MTEPEDTQKPWYLDQNQVAIVDLIARAIHRANDEEIGVEFDQANADDWYSREAIQVLEDLRVAGLDIVDEFIAIVNVPLPPVSLRRRSITQTLTPQQPPWAPSPNSAPPWPDQRGGTFTGVGTNGETCSCSTVETEDKLYGGND